LEASAERLLGRLRAEINALRPAGSRTEQNAHQHNNANADAQ
jgi:hypothetical protein